MHKHFRLCIACNAVSGAYSNARPLGNSLGQITITEPVTMWQYWTGPVLLTSPMFPSKHLGSVYVPQRAHFSKVLAARPVVTVSAQRVPHWTSFHILAACYWTRRRGRSNVSGRVLLNLAALSGEVHCSAARCSPANWHSIKRGTVPQQGGHADSLASPFVGIVPATAVLFFFFNFLPLCFFFFF